MPTSIEFCHAIPVMPALDLPKTIVFYEQQLGFTRKSVYDDYVGISRGSVEVHLLIVYQFHDRKPEKYLTSPEFIPKPIWSPARALVTQDSY